MDDMRDSFSRFKKGVKHRLMGKRKGDQPGTEGSETSGSVPRPEAGDAADEDGLDWKATVSASAKPLLRGARDSADALGPLKSVVGGLCFILENYEVCTHCNIHLQCSQALRSTKANKQAIKSLAPRVKALAELLCKPVSEGDARERERRQKLEQ